MPTPFRIIGLDPGGVTGWATYTVDRTFTTMRNDYKYSNEEHWECGQLGKDEHHTELYNFLGVRAFVPETIVVCESFNYRNQSRPGLELVSREYIGVTKLFCKERGIKYVEQSSAQGKITERSFVRKENLQKLGLWVKGGASTWNHAMDAYGHILYYMIHNDIRKQELLEKGWK